jgi:hypothetical protein
MDEKIEATDETIAPQLSAAKEAIELVGKLSIGIIAVLYLLGFVVVNTYLNNFGVFSPSLFRLNYITAGLWAITPIFLVILALSVLGSILIQFSAATRRSLVKRFNLSDNDSEHMFLRLWFTIGSLALLVLSIHWIGTLTTSAGFKASLFSINVAVSTFDVVFIGILFGPFAVLSGHALSKVIRTFLLVVILTGVLLAHSFIFAKEIYGNIPPSLGGGEPKEVQLVIDSDENKRSFFEDLGIQFLSQESNITVNVKLLLVTENEYVLLVENKKCCDNLTVQTGLTIQRDKIQAILYEGANFTGKGGGDSTF